jgi:hypothetical protein
MKPNTNEIWNEKHVLFTFVYHKYIHDSLNLNDYIYLFIYEKIKYHSLCENHNWKAQTPKFKPKIKCKIFLGVIIMHIL